MNRSGRLLRPYLWRQWRALSVATFASVASAAAELARPFPLKIVIDDIVGDHGDRPFSMQRPEILLLAVVAGLVVGIAVVDAVASYVVDVRLERAGERIVHDLRVATYGHLQRLSLAFHDRRPTGDLVTRVTGDVNAVGGLFSESLGTIATASLLLVGMLVVTLRMDPILALAAFSVTPALGFATVRFRRRLKTTARRQRAKEGEIASIANEALGAMRVVKSLGAERFERERLVRRSEDVRQAGIEVAGIEGRFTGVIDVVGAVGSALVLVVGVMRVANGHLSVGDLVVFISYARRLYRPLRDIARQASRVSRAMARADRIGEVLAADDLLPEAADAYEGPRARGDLALEGVTFAYSEERPILHDLTLDLPAGQRVAVVGPSGAGKSTVAALLARFYDPAGGRVLVDRRDLRTCSRSWLRDQVGLVLQDTVLFTGTVAENIAYGTDATREQVLDAAKAAGAHAFVSELPQGYDNLLGSSGVGLSGGQRQRIAIARTLLRDPPILVLDEPTTGLDPESEAQVLAGLDVLMRGRTVVMITHSMALAGKADRVVVIDGGRLVEEGPPSTLLEGKTAFRELAIRQGLLGPTSPVRPLPRDDALPTIASLLDPDAMTAVLQRTLGEESKAHGVADVRIHCLRYKPSTSLVVHYDVGLGGCWHHATAMIANGRSLARRAAAPVNVALADQVNGRSPAARPLSYAGDLDALIQWLPLDVSLPALAATPEAWRGRLRKVGVGVGPAEPVLLNYKPRRRAVLRLGRHVIKVYAGEGDFQRAARGLAAADGLRHVPSASCEAVIPDLSTTVQSLLRGQPPIDPLDVSVTAGRLVAELHRSDVDGLELLTPASQLGEAARSAALATTVVPELAKRVEHLLADLEADLPCNLAAVPSHGDFHARQLLIQDHELSLIDLDELCLAPAAFDLATYAAHLVRDGAEDLAPAGQALDAVLDGYGDRPEGLGWYLATAILRRAPFPFRTLEDHWPEGVAAHLAAAEAVRRW